RERFFAATSRPGPKNGAFASSLAPRLCPCTKPAQPAHRGNRRRKRWASGEPVTDASRPTDRPATAPGRVPAAASAGEAILTDSTTLTPLTASPARPALGRPKDISALLLSPTSHGCGQTRPPPTRRRTNRGPIRHRPRGPSRVERVSRDDPR